MQPTPPQPTDPETPNGSVKPDRATWLSVVKSALKGLKGWQAVPAIVIGLYLFVGIFGPAFAPFEPNKGTISDRLCPPLAIDALTIAQHPASRSAECSSANILGTDHIGRDTFSRLLHGARTSLWEVGPSVVLGTVLGTVIGVVINGWRRKPRLIAYLIASLVFVPFGVFLLEQPYTLYIFGVINSGGGSDHDAEWAVFLAFASAATVVALGIVAFAYRYDGTCRGDWFKHVDFEGSGGGFCRHLHSQIVALAPWIGLSAIVSAALIFLHSGSASVMTSAVKWSFEWDYLFDHIGMFGPVVPMVLVPIAFATFGAWWAKRHLVGRLGTAAQPAVSTVGNEQGDAVELTSEVSPPKEEASDDIDSQSDKDDGSDASIDVGRSLKGRRWVLTGIAIVVVISVVRFGVAEAIPVFRELTHDSTDRYQSALVVEIQGRQEALDCAYELRSRLNTLRGLPPEQLAIEPGQRCLELYFEHRNAPYHRLTFDYALGFVTQLLTLTLIASVVSMALWAVVSASSNGVRRTVEVCIVLITLMGLTMTFADTLWARVLIQWVVPVDLAIHFKGLTVARSLHIVRDFSVALGISYLMFTIAKPTIRFREMVAQFDALFNWIAYLVPSILLTSGLLIVFHHGFPVNFLFIDDALGMIVNPPEEHIYFSQGFPFRNWLWTYWFALVGYGAIVFGFFAAAIWGFRRYARSDVNGVDSTPISPDNPSQDADPIKGEGILPLPRV